MTGIDAIDVALPRYRVSAEAYRDGAGSFRGRIDQKAVLGHDEDAVTLAIDAARSLDLDGVSLLAVGSTTRPRAGTLTTGPIARSLGVHGGLRTVAPGASWKAGLEAVDVALGLGGRGLAVGVDAPHGRLGDPVDHVFGAGAAAVVTGEGALAELTGEAHYTDARLPSKFSKDGRVTDLDLGRYTAAGVGDAVETVVDGVLADGGFAPSDVSHVVLPQEDVKIGWRLGGRLGFDDGQRSAGWVVNRVGFAGAATPLLGLATTLSASEPGDRILVTAYGYGEGATALLFEAAGGASDLSLDLDARVAAAEPLEYPDYAALRGGGA